MPTPTRIPYSTPTLSRIFPVPFSQLQPQILQSQFSLTLIPTPRGQQGSAGIRGRWQVSGWRWQRKGSAPSLLTAALIHYLFQSCIINLARRSDPSNSQKVLRWIINHLHLFHEASSTFFSSAGCVVGPQMNTSISCSLCLSTLMAFLTTGSCAWTCFSGSSPEERGESWSVHQASHVHHMYTAVENTCLSLFFLFDNDLFS